MNLVILIGNLCQDVEVKTTSSGTTYLNNSIAVKRKFHKDSDPDTDFFNITIFGKSAEAAGKMLHKGSKIAITGTLQNDSYTNKEGKKTTTTKVMVNEWEFAESKGEKTETKSDGFLSIPDGLVEELPFS